MKTFKEVMQVFEIEGKLYVIDRLDKEFKIGTILFDSRKRDFIKLENEKDLNSYLFVAPELVGKMKEFKI